MRIILRCLFVLAMMTPAPALAQAAASRYKVPAVRGDAWKTANADKVGVDSTKLAGLTTAIRSWPELGVHAVLIERHGQLIYEEYFDGFDQKWGTSVGKVSMTVQTKHDLRSVTKSVVSALVGIAHAEGAIKSLDEPLVKWFPEYPELDTPDRRRVTLAHVLAMTSGFEWNEDIPYSDPRNDEIQMTRHEKPLLYALSRKFVVDPGSDFNYNGGLTQVMARINAESVG